MCMRDFGICIGFGMLGCFNVIMDVLGVWVGYCMLNVENGDVLICIGVIVIELCVGVVYDLLCFVGVYVLNGNGDVIGFEWICEVGLLMMLIVYMNMYSVGVVCDVLVVNECEVVVGCVYWCMLVVMEIYDGLLNDIWG